MADLLVKQENNNPKLYIAEINNNEAKYMSPILIQSERVKSTIGKDRRIISPIVNVIVTGTTRINKPARNLASNTW